MERPDLEQFRAEFKKVNRQDPQALRDWFKANAHFTTNDLAQIANCSIIYLNKLKRVAGISKKPNNKPPRYKVPAKSPITLPDNWDNPEWLQKALDHYSVDAIAKATSCTRWFIRKRIKKWGLKVRSAMEACRSSNPKCTYAWCYNHYITQRMSQKQCAELAGVTIRAFSGWLNRFKIPVRSTKVIIKDLRIKEFAHKLKQIPIVNKVFIRESHVHVRFKNFFWESYYFDNRGLRQNGERLPFSYVVNYDDIVINKVPEVLPEYEYDMAETTSPYAMHLIVSRQELNKATFIERRLALHEFVRQIISMTWEPTKYPESVLLDDKANLMEYDPSTYRVDGGYTVFQKKQGHGKKIITHFFELNEHKMVLRSPRFATILASIMLKKRMPFNTTSLIRIIQSRLTANSSAIINQYISVSIPDPVVYAVLLEDLRVRGTVFDLTPGFGNRAMACAMLGLKYTTIPTERFSKAMQNGFGEFIGLDYEEYHGQKVDFLIYDENFGVPDMEKVQPYLGIAKQLLVFSPRSEVPTLMELQPTAVINVKTKWLKKEPNHFFLW